MSQSERTKAKIKENLGLLMDDLRRRFGAGVDDSVEQLLFNALDWTANDVEAQLEPSESAASAAPATSAEPHSAVWWQEVAQKLSIELSEMRKPPYTTTDAQAYTLEDWRKACQEERTAKLQWMRHANELKQQGAALRQPGTPAEEKNCELY